MMRRCTGAIHHAGSVPEFCMGPDMFNGAIFGLLAGDETLLYPGTNFKQLPG